MVSRRTFARGFALALGTGTLQRGSLLDPRAAFAQSSQQSGWEAGKLFHVLPMVSHERILLKCSLNEPMAQSPELIIHGRRNVGRRTDSRGLYWTFDLPGLRPDTEYQVELRSEAGFLAEPWKLKTFPDPDSEAEHVRIVFYTCAGGHDALLPNNTCQSLEVRQALIKRALSFQPHAMVANGDQVYWDLFAPRISKQYGNSEAAIAYAGRFDKTKPIFGTTNEEFLLKTGAEQIAPLYRTMCRSVPVFFVQDDHDYYDNDEASDEVITFPPSDTMMRLARATQKLLYPEFLPDPNRPRGLPGTREDEGAPEISSNYGTLRYGKLLEVLLYDNRRSASMHGPTAVFVDGEVEAWLKQRMQDKAVKHVVNAPGLPPGWTKGNWYEWYPDQFEQGKASVAKPKPYWQSGWLAQHDRLIKAAHDMSGRIPLIISGDIHASAITRMQRTGSTDLSKNPVVSVLPGTIGTKGRSFPSSSRGNGIQTPNHLEVVDALKPVEQNGFMVADFYKDRVDCAFYVWDGRSQVASDISVIEAKHRATFQPVS